MKQDTRLGALVTTDWLADHLEDPAIAVVEVDEDTTAYGTGHIPGAVSLDWQHELHASPRRDFISGDELAALFAAKGVGDEQAIVLYGGNNNWFAAYAYWLCKYRGIDTVTLLDGGRTKWELEGRRMTTDTPTSNGARFTRVCSDRAELRATRDEIIDRAARGGPMVDVRSPAEFSGEVMAPPHLPQEQPYVAGHIPGATNIPWSQAANEDGSFRSKEELRKLYAPVIGNGSIVAYCRIGERSSHTWFVLSELLGLDDVKNYDGSWTEYGSLVGVPVELGS